jgi:hypothetical protein
MDENRVGWFAGLFRDARKDIEEPMPEVHQHQWEPIPLANPIRATILVWGCVGCTEVRCTRLGTSPDSS